MDADKETYERVVSGNKEAFKTLFYTYYDSLVRYSLGFVDEQEEAEDIVQDVFAYFWSNRETNVITTSVKAYLYTSVKYRSINFLKHKVIERNNHPYVIEFLENIAHEEYSDEESVQMQEIHDALMELPEQCRLVFTKTVLEGKSYKEIAVDLDISVNTVKSHVLKAYHNIRESVGNTHLSASLLYISLLRRDL